MFGGDQFGKKMLDRFFRKVDGVVWDLMYGQVGVLNGQDEIATLKPEGDDYVVNINPFDDFGIPIPAFAQNTPVSSIKVGDLIYNARKTLGWVIQVPEDGRVTFKLLKPDGTRGEWRPPQVQSLGLDLSGAMVLRSLINTVPGGDLSGLQGMLIPMLAMGGDFGDMESMLPLMLMGQAGGGAGSANMLQTMMMMKLLGGGKKKEDGNPGSAYSPSRISGKFFS